MKLCFHKTLLEEYAKDMRGTMGKSEAELTAHFTRVLQDKCVKSLGIDLEKDKWAALVLKQAVCTFSKSISATGCGSPGVKDRRQCVMDARKQCLVDATHSRSPASHSSHASHASHVSHSSHSKAKRSRVSKVSKRKASKASRPKRRSIKKRKSVRKSPSKSPKKVVRKSVRKSAKRASRR